ncbi:30S ribosomal protein S7 [Candidatus Curtissbacteria bacterium]|nr:30S ribosomal protein S7 [Candidatus Curtissbacteria bacterium]
MPRTGHVKKINVAPDPIYQNYVVAKLINKVMVEGKKAVAQKIVYGAFDVIKAKGQDPLATFEKALENISPKTEVRPRRVGGASYMVPIEVRGPRRQALAISWLVGASRARSAKEVERLKNKPLAISKLATEILEAAQGTGKAVAKREEIHRMAEANKAFSHFRW